MPQSSLTPSGTVLPSLADSEEVMPDELPRQKRSLVWREEPHPKNPGKRVKVPYYSSGKRRRGPLGSDRDLSQLTSLPEALEAATTLKMSGLGFAPVGAGIGAFELDNCLDEDGHLIESHAGPDLVLAADAAVANVDCSPSAHGR